MIDIDEDPYLIDSWEQYCNTCLASAKKDLFIKKISQYIFETNILLDNEIKSHVAKLKAELIHESTEEARRVSKKALEDSKKNRLSKFKFL